MTKISKPKQKKKEEKSGPYEPPLTKKLKPNPEIENNGSPGYDDTGNSENYEDRELLLMVVLQLGPVECSPQSLIHLVVSPTELVSSSGTQISNVSLPSSEESDENSDKNSKGKILPDKIDCVALMLKRRYGAKALSLDTLKGSDGVLYHYLKKDFKVDVQPIILKQKSNYDGKMQSIKISAIVVGGEVEYEFSSDEEIKASGNNKNVPKKTGKKTGIVEVEKNEIIIKNKEKMAACFVRGTSSKSLLELVGQAYVEHTGNEAQAAQYAYLHAALFVYPKSTKK